MAIKQAREALTRLLPVDLFRRLHENTSGATSTEYILILALVVLPIGLLTWTLFVPMARVYGMRVISLMPLPFP